MLASLLALASAYVEAFQRCATSQTVQEKASVADSVTQPEGSNATAIRSSGSAADEVRPPIMLTCMIMCLVKLITVPGQAPFIPNV